MLATLPITVVCLLLMALGGLVGCWINWAIYSWSIFSRRPLSPWMRLLEEEQQTLGDRSWLDRIPVVGWWFFRRKHSELGTGFWIRPMLIELTWVLGLPWFWHWIVGGGLLGFNTGTLPEIASWSTAAETWFWCHTILIALLFVATFIDFDEKLIPDQITVPGTLLGLTIAAAFPWSPLPELAASAGGVVVAPVHFRAPALFPEADHWCFQWPGIALAVGVFTIWILALFPRISPFHLGIGKGIKYTFASVLRPKRKTKCDFRIEQRGPFLLSYILGALFLVGVPLLLSAWCWLPAENWVSLMTAIIGMAVSGGLIWGIRIVAGAVLGMQAMGFGDVTLMAMIGTFIGWQASVSAFIYGIMLAMFCAILLFIIFQESYLAFGPYLAFGAIASIYWWESTWQVGKQGFFILGPWLLVVLLVSLVLMAVLLPLVRWLKLAVAGGEA